MKKLLAIAAAVLMSTAVLPATVSADEWTKTDTGYVYTYDDGTTAEKGWLTIDGAKYYITSKGVRKTGWLKTTAAKYYFGKDGKMYKSKWLTLKDGTKYYLRSNGKAATGSIKISGTVYNFGSDGKLIVDAEETTTTTETKKTTTVYRTPTGKKYHAIKDCGNGTYTAVSLDDAKAAGLKPCNKCIGE